MKGKYQKQLPRLPLDGSFDLTYRCDNNCRHCWLRIPPGAAEQAAELDFDTIRRIVNEARQLGCQAWSISGGEPLIREDFAEIFDYITRKAVSYSLNTNGTRITPQIARLLTRRGRTMVSLYGATSAVHDDMTRSPGSFEATMRGISALRDAGAEFIVQIVPMRGNHHQLEAMLTLARSLSPLYRLGAAWLWLSACGSAGRNRQITAQRLTAAENLQMNPPGPSFFLRDTVSFQNEAGRGGACGIPGTGEGLFGRCIENRNAFHLDPYGTVSFCGFITDPDLRADLRQMSFQQAWDEFIPSLSNRIVPDREYRENCGQCVARRDCRWCPVYAYLEHGRYTARVDYLCEMAAETRRIREEWKLKHIQYYRIAGITIQLSADVPLNEDSFKSVLKAFRVDGPGTDTISLHLASTVPARGDLLLGKEVYRLPPWAIYRQAGSWIYLGVTSDEADAEPYCAAIWDDGHNHGTIYRRGDTFRHTLLSLTTFSSDQILIARILADRRACYLHAAGLVIGGRGFLFVGHSEAGKSTISKMLRARGEILCDDRIVVRRWPEGFRIHGTWSHGEVPDVSPGDAPLRAIMFLEKADENALIPIVKKVDIMAGLLSHVVKALVTADWWEKTMDLAECIADEIPIYRLRFDRSGKVADLLEGL